MNTIDATIRFKGIDVAAGATGSFYSLAGKQTASYAAVTSVAPDENGDVAIDIAAQISDAPDFQAHYAYSQLSAPENLVFKVVFSGEYPMDGEFQIGSSNFDGFKVNRGPVENKELNASTTATFDTDLDFCIWLGDLPISGTASVSLKFYKIVSDPSGIDKQVKIAESILTLNNKT
ncbi:hypothetical protein [Desulfoluna spongiiphila]|uniref:Uncharacterized protein n=1 Tax=Desulfoluna spongiiphila TaxID=419481 RepID=A0A1G5HD35_9BACT|nr:hypothetical protein [Desulfoluna spongiiphila]SCY61676.1 hypothetical protein SAMN05216233_113108 [Desulfoluna spongiiphila]